MNTELVLGFLMVSIAVAFILFLLTSSSHRITRLSKKHLLAEINSPSIQQEDKETAEQQLLQLLRNKPKFPWAFFGISTAILLVGAWLLYWQIGTPNFSQKQFQAQPKAEMSLQEAIVDLEKRLQSQPNDLEGQMLLARSQMTVKNYTKAISAYRKADEISPNESVILTELAEAVALERNTGSFLGEPANLINRAVQLNPFNQKALFLQGMIFYEQGDLKSTETTWERLYGLLENEGAKQQLKQQLDGVKNQLSSSQSTMDSTVESTTKPATKPEAKRINLHITVKLAEDIKLKSKGLLFVSAKEPNGPPMPIAAKRIPISEASRQFPLQLTLTNQDSLQAQRLLSMFNDIALKAKISFSGTANAAADDLESTEIVIKIPENTNLFETNITLEINKAN